jgi:hypothetical protein
LDKTSSGPGTTVIEVLARQFDACVEVLKNFLGTTVSITHAAFTSRPPAAPARPVASIEQRAIGSPVRADSLIEALGLVMCLTQSIVVPATVPFHPD